MTLSNSSAESDSFVKGTIAEISANHLGSLERAKKLVRAAKTAGANFVKFQHYRPDTITANSTLPEFTIDSGLWAGRRLWDLYEDAMTPWEWTGELASVAKEVGIKWFSSPFDESAVDFLEGFDVELYKIASFEIIDLPLIRHVANTGKPMIISTGMATLKEIDDAVEAAEGAGCRDITLLRTNSGYPASIDEMDLNAIPFMRERWGYPVGLSDHTLGHTSAIVATALGARVFEKHFTLSRADGGPDAAFSAEPEELAEYVRVVSDAASSLGSPRFGPSPGEKSSLLLRPSLRAVEDIAEGETISARNVQSVRPAGGLAPDQIGGIVGKKAVRSIPVGCGLKLEDLA